MQNYRTDITTPFIYEQSFLLQCVSSVYRAYTGRAPFRIASRSTRSQSLETMRNGLVNCKKRFHTKLHWYFDIDWRLKHLTRGQHCVETKSLQQSGSVNLKTRRWMGHWGSFPTHTHNRTKCCWLYSESRKSSSLTRLCVLPTITQKQLHFKGNLNARKPK